MGEGAGEREGEGEGERVRSCLLKERNNPPIDLGYFSYKFKSQGPGEGKRVRF